MRKTIRQISNKLDITMEDVARIVASVLDRPYHQVHLDKAVDPQSIEELDRCVMQLQSGMPIEYITRKVQFLDFTLNISPGVFIPRVETELLIQCIKDQVPREPRRILELGTGTGAISVALAHLFPRARIIATDICSKALSNASENIRKYRLDNRISLIQCNLFNGLTSRFDVIVSNPPYVSDDRFCSLPRSVHDFEPVLALRGGYQGIDVLKSIIQRAHSYVLSPGLIALEIDDHQPQVLCSLSHLRSFSSYVFLKDLFGRFRYLLINP